MNWSIITTRLPAWLHQRLKDAAWQDRMSVNGFVVRAIERAIGETLQADDTAEPGDIAATLESEGE
jgi:hypothetical protein